MTIQTTNIKQMVIKPNQVLIHKKYHLIKNNKQINNQNVNIRMNLVTSTCKMSKSNYIKKE